MTQIRWCHTHQSQVVTVEDHRGIRIWCPIGDELADGKRCLIGQAEVTPRGGAAKWDGTVDFTPEDPAMNDHHGRYLTEMEGK